MTTPLRKDERYCKRYNLLTVAKFHQLIVNAYGHVRVLWIEGSAHTGKSWAASSWAAALARSALYSVAYIDSRAIGFGRQALLAMNGAVIGLDKGLYPMFALAGADVFILDEPQYNPELVQAAFLCTTAQRTTYTHGLLVVRLQRSAVLELLGSPRDAVQVYDIDARQRRRPEPR